jgi:hypothetical protein
MDVERSAGEHEGRISGLIESKILLAGVRDWAEVPELRDLKQSRDMTISVTGPGDPRRRSFQVAPIQRFFRFIQLGYNTYR